MSDKIEIGTRVKVTHNKARDSFWDDVERETRRLCDGQIGEVLRVSPLPPLTVFVQVGARRAWFGPDELTPIVTDPDGLPVDDARPGDGAHLHSIVESAQAFSRAAFGWQREASAARAAIAGWVARCDALREEVEREKAARVEAERRENEARADREALEARIQVAQVALDAVRLAWTGHEDARTRGEALDRLDRALRGVPAADRVPADIPAAVLRLELERANRREAEARARTVAGRAAAAALRGLLNPAQGNMVPNAEEVTAALDALDWALAEEAAPRDRGRQGERFHAPATIEARLAEVERLIGSMSDHLAALDQRVAGLGNGLDEVRAKVQAPGEFDARPSGDR